MRTCSWRVGRRVSAVALSTVLLLPAMLGVPRIPLAAAQGTSVFSPDFLPSQNEAQQQGTTWFVTFATSQSGAVAAGGTITLDAPQGTTWPTAVGDYAVSDSLGKSTSVIGVTYGTGASGAAQVTITLGTSNITAFDEVEVVVQGVSNPATGNDPAQDFSVATSADTQPASPAQGIAFLAPPPTGGFLSIATASLPTVQALTPYDQTLQATGGSGSGYVWSVAQKFGELPTGMALTQNGDVVGIAAPSGPGSMPFLATVSDPATGELAAAALTLTVTPPQLQIETANSLPDAYVQSFYSVNLAATGGSAPYTWSLAQGSALPSGLTLTTNGTLNGTPLSQGSTSFTVVVTDHAGGHSPETISLTVGQASGTVPSMPAEASSTSDCASQVFLSWTAVPGATGYVVYDEGLHLLKTVAGGATSAVLAGLTNPSQHYAVAAVENGITGNPLVLPPGESPLQSPLLSAAPGSQNGSVLLSWTPVPGAAGYVVEAQDPSSMLPVAAATVAGSTYSDATLTGLSPQASLDFSVTAVGTGGAESSSLLSGTVGSLSPPIAPSVSAMACGSTGVALAWTAVPGATGYEISGTPGVAQMSVGAGVQSYSLQGLAPGTQYDLTVSALGSGLQSTSASATTATLGTPQDVAATLSFSPAGAPAITVDWQSVEGATGYNVYRASATQDTVPAQSAFQKVASPTSAVYQDASLAQGSYYFYEVTATEGGAESPDSAVSNGVQAVRQGTLTITPALVAAGTTSITVSGTGFAAGEAITSLTASANGQSGFSLLPQAQLTADSSGAFTVQATIPAGEAGGNYLVAAQGSDGTAASASFWLGSQGTSLTVTPSSASQGQTVTIQGAGFTPNDTVSLYSPQNSGLAFGAANAAGSDASGAFTLSWTVPQDLAPGSYEIVADAESSQGQATVAWTTLTVTAAASGTAASLGFVQGTPAAILVQTPFTVQVAVETGQGSALQTSSDQIDLSLVAPSGSQATLAGTASATAVDGVATFQGLSIQGAGGTGSYALKAVDATDPSVTSATSTAFTVDATPPPPTSLAATEVSPTSVQLSWAPVDVLGVTGEDIYEGTPPNGTSLTTTSSAQQDTYTVQGLTANSSYSFYLQSASALGEGAPSSAVSVQTALAPPSGLQATPNANGDVVLTWQVVSYATGYDVYEATSATGPFTSLTPSAVTGTTYTTGVLAPDATYYFTVATIMGQAESPQSQAVSATAAIATPQGLSVTASEATSVSLAWQAVSGAQSYTVLESASGGAFAALSTGAISTTSYTVTGLSPDTAYAFEVEAVDQAGQSSPPSTSVQVTTAQSVTPAAIELVTGPPGVAQVGTAFTVDVAYLDANGKPIPSGDVTDPLVLTLQVPKGAVGQPVLLPGDSACVQSGDQIGQVVNAPVGSVVCDVSGTLSLKVAGGVGQGITLTAQDPLRTAVQTVTSDPFTVNGPASLKIVAALPKWVVVPGPGVFGGGVNYTSQATPPPLSQVEVQVYDLNGQIDTQASDSIGLNWGTYGCSSSSVTASATKGVASFTNVAYPSNSGGGGTVTFVGATDCTNPWVPAAESPTTVLVNAYRVATTNSQNTAQAYWPDALPPLDQPGQIPSGASLPWEFAGVHFSLDYSAGDVAILSGSQDGTQPLCVDGSWQVSISGPVDKTLTGTGGAGGCSGQAPLNLGSLNLPTGQYGVTVQLFSPSTGSTYASSDVYFITSDLPYDAWDLSAPIVTRPLVLTAGAQGVVGQSTSVPLDIAQSSGPVEGYHTEVSYDPTALSIQGSCYWNPPPGHLCTAKWIGSGSADVGQSLMSLRVTCLKPGTWPVTFDGNYYLGLASVMLPSSVSVSCAAPPAAPAALVGNGATVTASGDVDVGLSGQNLNAAATVSLQSASGQTVASGQVDSASLSPTFASASFAAVAPGYYTAVARDPAGNTLASVSQVFVPPSIPLFSVVRADQLNQQVGYPITHFWRVTNLGTADGWVIAGFVFAPYLDKPILDTSFLPQGAELLTEIQTPVTWVAYVALPVQVGQTVDVPWTVTLPPSASIGGGTVPMFGKALTAVTDAQWAQIRGEPTDTLLGDAVEMGGQNFNAVNAALAQLGQASQQQLARYIAALRDLNPKLMEAIAATGLAQIYDALRYVAAQQGQLASAARQGPTGLRSAVAATRRPVAAMDSRRKARPRRATAQSGLGFLFDPTFWGDYGHDVFADPQWTLSAAQGGATAALNSATFNGYNYAFQWLTGATPQAGAANPEAFAMGQTTGDVVELTGGTVSLANDMAGLADASSFVDVVGGNTVNAPLLQEDPGFMTSMYGESSTLPDGRSVMFQESPGLSDFASYWDGGIDAQSVGEFSGGTAPGYPDGLVFADYQFSAGDLNQAYGPYTSWALGLRLGNVGVMPQLTTLGGWMQTLTAGYNTAQDAQTAAQLSQTANEGSSKLWQQIDGYFNGPYATNSHDPNDIAVLPQGAGAKDWITTSEPLTITVHFENDGSAPARNIRVVLPLDPNLDPSTLHDLGSSFPGEEFSYDPTSGTVTWYLPNVNLPPDTSPPDGEGYVALEVSPQAGLANGTQIQAQARVYFDYNAPVVTPAQVRTLDLAPPIASVATLPASAQAGPLPVSWSGQSAAGIADYRVYVSQDGGPLTLWQTTSATSATYDVSPGQTYGFAVQAVDIAGLEGTMPTSPQATVAVAAGGGHVAAPPASQPTESLAQTVQNTGGVLATKDGSFTMDVPAGAVAPGQSLAVNASSAASEPLPAAMQQLSDVFTLSGATLSAPQTATIRFDPSVLGGRSAARLSIYRLTDSGWVFVPSTVNALQGTVAAKVAGPETLVAVANTQKFLDIPKGYWARTYIDRLLGASVVGGYPDGTFRPGAPLTRAAFVKMLVGALGLPLVSGTTPFHDVPRNAWYAAYVAAALQSGIVGGLTPATFGPGNLLTREDMAVLLARALKLQSGGTPDFRDSGLIGQAAQGSVAAVVAAGYLSGFPNGTFRPDSYASRAEAAKVIALLIEHLAAQ